MDTDQLLLDFKPTFNPAISDAAAERATYQEGWVQSLITGIERQFGEKKPQYKVSPRYAMLKVGLKPLKEPNNPDSGVGFGFNTWICQPFELPHWKNAPEEEYERFMSYIQGGAMRDTHAFLHALLGEDAVPDVPRKIKGIWTYQGEDIGADKSTRKACEVEAYATAQQVAVELWEKGYDGIAEGCVVYHRITYEKDKKTGDVSDFPSVKGWSAEHPVRNNREVTLNTGAAIMGVSASGAVEAPSRDKKPSKKKASKKTKK